MTEITREGDMKLEVMSTNVEGKQKCKNIMSNWRERKKKENKLKTEKIYMPNEWRLKKFEKKNKKEPENVVEKRKKMEKKWGTIRTLLFQWLLNLGLMQVFSLYCFVKIVLLKILLISSTRGRAAR